MDGLALCVIPLNNKQNKQMSIYESHFRKSRKVIHSLVTLLGIPVQMLTNHKTTY